MLYHIFYPLHEVYSWLNVFRYQTFRGMLAFLLSFLLVLILEPKFIEWLRKKGVKGQPIRDDGPKDHISKQGTPTMGGAVIVFSVLISTLLLADLTKLVVWLALAVMLAYAAVGFIDDWRKVTHQNSKGLSERGKLLCQCFIAVAASLMLINAEFSTVLSVPFLKDLSFPLGAFFIPFVILVVVGCSNAVNLTDGLDGLAIGPIMTVAFTYAVFAYLTGNVKLAEYLGLFHVHGAGELSIILAALLAGGLGFLWYNTFPAQIFMGDTGALGIGGLLGFIAVLVKHELVLVIAGGVFVIEALSVIIQRYSFKMTGKRVFRMAPIHHHFELKGWAEPKIIVRFWIVSIVLALISLTTLKLR
ncbi:MAG: phospho-N-acetylmuramoyl-pentapeptide-transferase [Deltaproteobacteria bacterium]|nr:phospho-N-acetylmuramoyl-pentapeptide-transferase [Deltaproteobacteria bacterium]